MTSLADVYDGDVGNVADRGRRRFGTALYLLGAAAVVAAIVMATTGVRELFDLGLYQARTVAGVLAGVGIPAVFVGFFSVLPAGRAVRATAAIGASLALFGVSLFAYAYPDRWLGVDPALPVAAFLLYGLGTLTIVWCLFAALATFKTRNDPGGTARVEITEEGRIRLLEPESDSPSFPGFGSVGLFGSGPDGEVKTQTNRSQHAADGGVGAPASGDGGVELLGEDADSGPQPTATSDGGAVATRPHDVDSHGEPDPYCGNCVDFEYVRVDGELVPYCGFHDGLLADMEACEQWSPNH